MREIRRHRLGLYIRRLVIIGTLCLACSVPAAATDHAPTRVMRFVSTAEGFAGLACFGMVWRSVEDVPVEVVNLGYLDERLCRADREADSDPAEIRLAFETAAQARTKSPFDMWIESIRHDELAERVLPPVTISPASLGSRRRAIVGVGLNYARHGAEVGAGDEISPEDLIFFPKPTPPTGPYTPVKTGVRIGSDPPMPVVLMDYEVEIGFVLLEDIDLNNPPKTLEELRRQIAYFVANDVSDRTPIILDSEAGFTRGKSHPGYLPIGPWMVHGRDLDLRAGGAGSQVLRLELIVAMDSDGETHEEVRQYELSEQMIHGPLAVVHELARRYEAGEALCMPDAWGRPATVHDGRGRIPAGSIILTGTPGGTAIRTPRFLDKLRLFIAGGFSMRGAREELIQENRQAAFSLGYLKPEQQVHTSIELLGTQIWRVMPSETDTTHGVPGIGSCENFEAE